MICRLHGGRTKGRPSWSMCASQGGSAIPGLSHQPPRRSRESVSAVPPETHISAITGRASRNSVCRKTRGGRALQGCLGPGTEAGQLACGHARTHARVHARTHARTHVCTHARTHAARTHARMRVRMHIRTHARTRGHMHSRAQWHTVVTASPFPHSDVARAAG